jgi:Ca-activated chloride channel family protein
MVANISRAWAQDADELYRQGKYDEARKEYQKMDLENPRDIRFRYNRGCASFKNSDYQGARNSFASVLGRSQDQDVRFRSLFNLGNTAFQEGKFDEAAKLFQQAVLLSPDDQDARYNYELALRKKSDAQNKQKNQDDQKDKKGEPDKNKKEDKNEGDNSKDKNDKNKKNPGENKNSPQDSERQKQPLMGQLDQEKAKALLDNIKENRAKFYELQSRGKKKNPQQTEKYW